MVFANVLVPVLLLVPRCPGEPFSGVLAWSSCLDSSSSEQPLASKLSSGWVTRSRYCICSLHPVLVPSVQPHPGSARRADGGTEWRSGRDCTLTNFFVWHWRKASSFLVFYSRPDPLVRSPLQAGAVPCGLETAHQCHQLRFQRVVLWQGSEVNCGAGGTDPC